MISHNSEVEVFFFFFFFCQDYTDFINVILSFFVFVSLFFC